MHVRLMHAFVGYHHEHETDWDSGARGLPVNQFDQAGTLGLFSITFLLHTRVLGVRYTRREADAVLHLWCYVGWLMGVDRRWLPFDERAGLRMMYQIGASSPAADEHSYALAASLVDLPLHTHYPGSSGCAAATSTSGACRWPPRCWAGRGAGAAGAGAPALVPAGPARRERPKHHVLARFRRAGSGCSGSANAGWSRPRSASSTARSRTWWRCRTSRPGGCEPIRAIPGADHSVVFGWTGRFRRRTEVGEPL